MQRYLAGLVMQSSNNSAADQFPEDKARTMIRRPKGKGGVVAPVPNETNGGTTTAAKSSRSVKGEGDGAAPGGSGSSSPRNQAVGGIDNGSSQGHGPSPTSLVSTNSIPKDGSSGINAPQTDNGNTVNNRQKNDKAVEVYHDGRVIARFRTQTECARYLRATPEAVSYHCSKGGGICNTLLIRPMSPSVAREKGGGSGSGGATAAEDAQSFGLFEGATDLRPVQRPQLKPETVAILREWLLSPDHVDNPYPNVREMEALMERTGLYKIQLKHWFNNARKRILKPLLKNGNLRMVKKRHSSSASGSAVGGSSSSSDKPGKKRRKSGGSQDDGGSLATSRGPQGSLCGTISAASSDTHKMMSNLSSMQQQQQMDNNSSLLDRRERQQSQEFNHSNSNGNSSNGGSGQNNYANNGSNSGMSNMMMMHQQMSNQYNHSNGNGNNVSRGNNANNGNNGMGGMMAMMQQSNNQYDRLANMGYNNSNMMNYGDSMVGSNMTNIMNSRMMMNSARGMDAMDAFNGGGFNANHRDMMYGMEINDHQGGYNGGRFNQVNDYPPSRGDSGGSGGTNNRHGYRQDSSFNSSNGTDDTSSIAGGGYCQSLASSSREKGNNNQDPPLPRSDPDGGGRPDESARTNAVFKQQVATMAMNEASGAFKDMEDAFAQAKEVLAARRKMMMMNGGGGNQQAEDDPLVMEANARAKKCQSVAMFKLKVSQRASEEAAGAYDSYQRMVEGSVTGGIVGGGGENGGGRMRRGGSL